MQLTTKTIIKSLPFEQSFKHEILEQFDTLDVNTQNEIARIAWDTFYALYELRLEENTQLAFLKAQKNQEKLDENFYKQVKEKTQKELENELAGTTQETDLTAARKAMELIAQEIKAAKKARQN